MVNPAELCGMVPEDGGLQTGKKTWPSCGKTIPGKS
jgi:hypothetical protein